MLLAIAGAAIAGLYVLAVGGNRADEGVRLVEIGSRALRVDPALLRDAEQVQTRVIDRLDLVVGFDDFRNVAPTAPPEAQVHLALTRAGDDLDPADRPAALYAKFVSPEVWTNPGGLVMRRFRTGSPYEDEELYLALPDERVFAARCPRRDLPTEAPPEPCLWLVRQNGLDIQVRFSPTHLVDWAGLRERTFALLSKIGATP